MNLALSALLIILFLLPAFFFRIGIFLPMTRKNEDVQIIHDIISRNVSKVLAKLSFTETVFLFSIIPIILHSASLSIMSLAGANIDYGLLLNIFAGKQNVLADGSNYVFQHKLLSFLEYTLIETIFACLLGWVLLKCLGGKKWLLKTLVGNNTWFRLFTGASLELQKKGLVLVEALVETKETTIIYSGLLKKYELTDNSNELAYILLTGVIRRDLRKAQQISKDLDESKVITSSSFHAGYGDVIRIPGDIFTIFGKEIINLNVKYIN